MTERERSRVDVERQMGRPLREAGSDPVASGERRSIVGPHILLGLGIGGFFDGIFLHQVLQWHHMVSTSYPPTNLANLEFNTLADGIFHVVTLLLTIVGLLALWHVVRQGERVWSARGFAGGLLIGWGIFNILDEIINHALLELHHIRPGPNQFAWDMGFTAWGAVMLLAGWLLIRARQRTRRERK